MDPFLKTLMWRGWGGECVQLCTETSLKHPAVLLQLVYRSQVVIMHAWLLFAHYTSFLFHCFLIVTASPHHQVTSLTCQVRPCSPFCCHWSVHTRHSVYIHVKSSVITCCSLSVCRGWRVRWVSAVRIQSRSAAAVLFVLFLLPPSPKSDLALLSAFHQHVRLVGLAWVFNVCGVCTVI